jgi:hypothetical protein
MQCAYQLLAGLLADTCGGGGEVDAGEELLAARAGERGDEVWEAQKLGCARTGRRTGEVNKYAKYLLVRSATN